MCQQISPMPASEGRPLLTERFHIILMAKGKAGARGTCTSSFCGRTSGLFAGRIFVPFATIRFWGNTGTVASYTAALQPLPMDCPIRYSSSRKPCQRQVSSGSGSSLLFRVKISCERKGQHSEPGSLVRLKERKLGERVAKWGKVFYKQLNCAWLLILSSGFATHMIPLAAVETRQMKLHWCV